MSIHEWVIDIRTRCIEWFKERAHGTHARAWLFILAFAESSFFLIPADVLLVAILLAGAQRWWYYALITSAGSVLGGVAGYLIGLFFYDTVGVHIVSFYELESEFRSFGTWFSDAAFWTMFLAAFTPVPYKAFVLAAGFFKVNFAAFFVASAVGRAMRFFAVAYLTHRYRPTIVSTMLRYFTIVTYVFVGLFVLWLLATFI